MGEPTSDCNNASEMDTYVANLLKEVARLSKDKAAALQEVADIQKEHAATTTRYKDIHARLTQAEEARLGLHRSVHNRIAEKNEVIAMNNTLTKKNADLMKIHADLSHESAQVKSENAEMVSALQRRDAFIAQLRTQVASAEEIHDVEQKQHEAVKVERDRLQKQVEDMCQTQRRDSHRDRGRSKPRSRSPRRSPSPDYRHSRYRKRSRGRSDYAGREYHRYEHYNSRYDDPSTHTRRRERNRSASQELYPPAPHESNRLPSPRKTPDKPSAPSDKAPHDLTDPPNSGRIPKAPKAQILFSMRQLNKKSPPKSSKWSKDVKRSDHCDPD